MNMIEDLDWQRRVDAICNEFEEQWSVSARPNFQEFLNRVEQQQCEQLLENLIAVDVELRIKAGQTIKADDYQTVHDLAAEMAKRCLESRGFPVDGIYETVDCELSETRNQNIADENIESIGPYRLRSKIGEGGMGSVWLAEQQEPIRRQVALKVIKTGAGGREITARFDAERQALALMNHPNIARILDAGTTPAGRPYFAMELVDGLPLTTYSDQHRLQINDRLRLFADVCSGLQHAHQKGIIHRDLKPSNILVAEVDSKAVPKVIDFGLAKALESNQRLTDQSLYTGIGQILGTLKYMSPEQASLDATDIDTRTDIYSLGVVLYELLTGVTPLDDESVRGKAMLDILQTIRDQIPIKPSSRLFSSQQSISSVMEQRQTDSNSLNRILVGDLDWIVIKALEKDRARRYETASELAADINRYLNGDAIEARPPSKAYRVSKFVNKNRGLVVSAVSILALLILGITGTSIGLYQAEAAREVADRKTEIANRKTKEAIFQKERAEKEKKRANDEAKNARTAESEAKKSAKRSSDVLLIVTDSFNSTHPNKGSNAQMTAMEVLLNAQASLKDSELDDQGKAILLWALSSSFLGIGEHNSAISTSTQMLASNKAGLGEYHRDTLMSMNMLANSYHAAGRRKEALELREETLRLLKEKLGENHADTLVAMNNLANSYRFAGRLDDALELFEKTLAMKKAKHGEDHPETLMTMSNLANIYHETGRVDAAQALFEETLSLKKAKLGEDHPETLSSMSNLAASYLAAGRLDDALERFEKAFALQKEKLGEDHAATLITMGNLAICYGAAGRLDDAVELDEKTLDLRTAKLGEDHPDTLISMQNLAASYDNAGRPDDAIELNERSLLLMKKRLGENHPHTLQTMGNLASSYYSSERFQQAMELREKTLLLMRANLGEDHSNTLMMMNHLVASYNAAGRVEDAKKLRERTRVLRKANRAKARALKKSQQDLDTLNSMQKLAENHYSDGKPEEALDAYQGMLPILQRLVEEHPAATSNQTRLASIHNRIGFLYEETGKPSDALDSYQNAVLHRAQAFKADTKSFENCIHFYIAYDKLVSRLGDKQPNVDSMMQPVVSEMLLAMIDLFRQVYEERLSNSGANSPTVQSAAILLADSLRLANRESLAAELISGLPGASRNAYEIKYDVPAEENQALFAILVSDGFIPISVEVSIVNKADRNKLTYRLKNKTNVTGWELRTKISQEFYEARKKKWAEAGGSLIHYQDYEFEGREYVAALWHKVKGAKQ